MVVFRKGEHPSSVLQSVESWENLNVIIQYLLGGVCSCFRVYSG